MTSLKTMRLEALYHATEQDIPLPAEVKIIPGPFMPYKSQPQERRYWATKGSVAGAIMER